jgi:hypothetical protein
MGTNWVGPKAGLKVIVRENRQRLPVAEPGRC